MTATAAKAATCTEPGNSAYWKCTVCNKYFSDEAGLAEIEENSWIIPAAGHTMTATAAKAATCTEPGNSAYWKCTVCNKYFSDAEGNAEIEENSWIIPATGHSMTATAAKAATCTEPGNSAYWKCTVCNKYFSDEAGLAEIEENSWIIPATGHNMTATAAKAATCTEPGNSAYWKCTVCNKHFSDAEGNAEIEENSWIIPATGHNMTATAAKAATCTEPGNSAYWKCTVCNKYFSDAEGNAEIEENSWIIPAAGHDWSEPNYEWSVDNTQVVATRICAHNASHKETETVDTVRELVTAPTDEEAGVYQIVSKEFENIAFTTQRKENLVIRALNSLNVLKLPAFLKTIETEAFENIAAEAIIIPNECTTIESKAFINCKNLLYIRIPAGIEIPDDAFDGCPNVVIDQR